MSWPRKNHFANQQNDVRKTNEFIEKQTKKPKKKTNYQKNLEFENPKEELI